jgi:hypothetical protein
LGVRAVDGRMHTTDLHATLASAFAVLAVAAARR